jgi:hypothetical protein
MKVTRFSCCLGLLVLFLGGAALGAVEKNAIPSLSPEAQTAAWAQS